MLLAYNWYRKASVKEISQARNKRWLIETGHWVRVDNFNKKLKEPLDDGNFWVNSDVDGKFNFILPGEDLSKNLGVNYDRGVMPTD